jgi:GTP cyclohydrolase III
MDIFFTDPTEIPLPPAEIRIQALQAEPYPDGRRVKISLEITPFQKRPSADLMITDTQGQIAAQASIIETITRKMELTMHLRGPQPGDAYQVHVSLFYEQAPEAGEEGSPPDKTVVDQGSAAFTVA